MVNGMCCVMVQCVYCVMVQCVYCVMWAGIVVVIADKVLGVVFMQTDTDFMSLGFCTSFAHSMPQNRFPWLISHC